MLLQVWLVNIDCTFQGSALVASVFFLRCKIDSLKNVKTNLKLVLIHLFNFILFFSVLTINEVLSTNANKISNANPDNYHDDVKW